MLKKDYKKSILIAQVCITIVGVQHIYIGGPKWGGYFANYTAKITAKCSKLSLLPQICTKLEIRETNCTSFLTPILHIGFSVDLHRKSLLTCILHANSNLACILTGTLFWILPPLSISLLICTPNYNSL